jgi:FKBP-type peptidyl-prolyl cis-trans isomerase (trigger factor)
MENTNYKITNSKEIREKSLKEIEVEIPENIITSFRKKALSKIKETVELPGFRKGKVPEDIIANKVGETAILDESIEIFIKENMAEILEKEASDTIASPSISIKTAVPGNPVSILISAPLKPKIKLADYKKIASETNKNKVEKIEVKTEEIDEALLRIRKYIASAEGKKPEELKDEKNLPELNDETVKKIGSFKNLEEFKEKVKKDILEDKTLREREKQRIAIMDKVIKESEGTLPDILIDYEIERMKDEFRNDVERMGLKLENYLKDAGKKEEDLSKEWREPAIKRVKTEIILREIALIEKIEADKDQVKKESEHMLEHYKDADPKRVEAYINDVLRKEKVFAFLENL